jgi:septum formation protein
MNETRVILASASPRRAALLDQIGVAYRVHAVDIDETRRDAESPTDYVRRVALDKARAGWRQTGQDERQVVLAADTAVVLDDKVLGKPADRSDAHHMLRMLSGRRHTVISAVALVSAAGEDSLVNLSEVTFRDLPDEEIDSYWDTGEAKDKAGAYAIQGAAAVFIENLQGSYSGVMGLPVFETARLLRKSGAWIPCSAKHDAA